MAGLAGYTTTVKMTGTPTAMSSEAMSTNSTAANTYKVTTATKRIFDRAASFSFFEATTTGGRAAIAAGDISAIDYLFGKVTFSSTQSEPVTVSGNYLPATNVAGANTYGMDMTRELLDRTDFTSTGFRQRHPGLVDVSLTVSRFDSVDLTFINAINSTQTVVCEVRPGGTGSSEAGRGFFLVESENRSGDISGLETGELSFQLDGSSEGAFSWGVP